ncbi:MAG: hypothetical protein JWO31_2650, partial [Phycisphaerales bacterium]|nr:hypothetical protein [Phycisphaerales bacterium]
MAAAAGFAGAAAAAAFGPIARFPGGGGDAERVVYARVPESPTATGTGPTSDVARAVARQPIPPTVEPRGAESTGSVLASLASDERGRTPGNLLALRTVVLAGGVEALPATPFGMAGPPVRAGDRFP